MESLGQSFFPLESVLFDSIKTICYVSQIRVVLLSIEKDCNRYTSRSESTILHGYKVQGRKIVINYALYTYMTLFSYLAVPSVPLVLDVVMPLNQSREKQYIFIANYGVDNEEYYYYLCIHMYIGAIAVGHLFAVCESMYVLYVRHADALFAIVSHQVKTVHVLRPKGSINVEDGWILEEYGSREFKPDEQEQLYKKLCVCIQDHHNAIEWVLYFNNSKNSSYNILMQKHVEKSFTVLGSLCYYRRRKVLNEAFN